MCESTQGTESPKALPKRNVERTVKMKTPAARGLFLKRLDWAVGSTRKRKEAGHGKRGFSPWKDKHPSVP